MHYKFSKQVLEGEAKEQQTVRQASGTHSGESGVVGWEREVYGTHSRERSFWNML